MNERPFQSPCGWTICPPATKDQQRRLSIAIRRHETSKIYTLQDHTLAWPGLRPPPTITISTSNLTIHHTGHLSQPPHPKPSTWTISIVIHNNPETAITPADPHLGRKLRTTYSGTQNSCRRAHDVQGSVTIRKLFVCPRVCFGVPCCPSSQSTSMRERSAVLCYIDSSWHER